MTSKNPTSFKGGSVKRKAKTRTKLLIIIAIIILLFTIILIFFRADIKKLTLSNWKDIYEVSRQDSSIPDFYLLKTANYNYDSPLLQSTINQFSSKNYPNTINVIEDIGDYVYYNVQYRDDLTYEDCLLNTASNVLERGYGICSTMSKLDIALLRGLGIASRPVIGCIKNKENLQCIPLRFKQLPQAIIQERIRLPRISEIEVNKEGYVVSKGGLHTWIEVWIPEKGWMIFEPTTGYLIDSDCMDYKSLKVNPNEVEICGLNYFTNKDFIDECRNF